MTRWVLPISAFVLSMVALYVSSVKSKQPVQSVASEAIFTKEQLIRDAEYMRGAVDALSDDDHDKEQPFDTARRLLQKRLRERFGLPPAIEQPMRPFTPYHSKLDKSTDA